METSIIFSLEYIGTWHRDKINTYLIFYDSYGEVLTVTCINNRTGETERIT